MKMRTEALKKKAKLTLKLIYTRQKPTQEKVRKHRQTDENKGRKLN